MHAKRHPLFEGLVFGLAGLLALFILGAVARQVFLSYASNRPAADRAPILASAGPPVAGSGYDVAPAELPAGAITSGPSARRSVDVPAPAK